MRHLEYWLDVYGFDTEEELLDQLKTQEPYDWSMGLDDVVEHMEGYPDEDDIERIEHLLWIFKYSRELNTKFYEKDI